MGEVILTPKLIALDLDGTTLNADGKLSPLTKTIIHDAQAAGHRVVLATGRPDTISEPIYDELGLTTPMINFNGALVHVPHEHWNFEYMQTLGKATVIQLLALRQAFPIKVMVAEGKHMLLTDRAFSNIPFMPDMLHPAELLSAQTLQQEPISLTIFTPEESVPALRQAILAKQFPINVQSWGSWSGENAALEVVRAHVNKAVALSFVAQKLGIQPANIIAFGDDENDLEMLKFAGLGVAMANSNPSILTQISRQTAAPNTEDGMARFLANYLELSESEA